MLVALATATAAPVAHPAAGAERPPDSAVSQYIESIPSSDGTAASGQTGTGDGSTGGSALPPELAQEIAARGGDDAPALEELVTSPQARAPASAEGGAASEPRTTSDPGAVSAAVEAASEGSDGTVIGVVVVLLAIAAVAVVAAARRVRRQRP